MYLDLNYTFLIRIVLISVCRPVVREGTLGRGCIWGKKTFMFKIFWEKVEDRIGLTLFFHHYVHGSDSFERYAKSRCKSTSVIEND